MFPLHFCLPVMYIIKIYWYRLHIVFCVLIPSWTARDFCASIPKLSHWQRTMSASSFNRILFQPIDPPTTLLVNRHNTDAPQSLGIHVQSNELARTAESVPVKMTRLGCFRRKWKKFRLGKHEPFQFGYWLRSIPVIQENARQFSNSAEKRTFERQVVRVRVSSEVNGTMNCWNRLTEFLQQFLI